MTAGSELKMNTTEQPKKTETKEHKKLVSPKTSVLIRTSRISTGTHRYTLPNEDTVPRLRAPKLTVAYSSLNKSCI